MGPAVSRWARRGVLWPMVALTAVYVSTIFGIERGESGFSPAWDGWVYNVVLVGASLACAVRAITYRPSRWMSGCVAIGLAAWAIGNIYWTAALQGMEEEPFPSWADAGYLAFYPPMAVAVLVLAARQRGRGRDPVVLMDGLIGGFSVAAIVAVFALGPVAAAATGTRAAIATNVAYPIGDMLILTLLLTVAGLAGWRLSRSQVVTMISLATFVVADSVYLVQVATDSYVSGTLLDAGWIVPTVAIACAQWLDDPADAPVGERPTHGRAVWVPVTMVVLGLAVCGWYASRELPVVATATMGAAVLCAVGRMIVTLKEMERLAASERAAREDRIAALAQAADEIARANAELEDRVRDRTTELEAANARLVATADRLRQSNRELQDFAYVASHDLQEPLRKVQAFGSRLEARYTDALPDEGRDYLARMQGAALRMSTLIDDLLTFSRVSTRARVMERVDLVQIAREVVSDLEIALEQTGGAVRFGALPSIEGDPTQLRQLLQNLVGNALKFHREGVAPEVTISGALVEAPPSATGAAPLGTHCRLEVTDNGIGFEERYLDRIFTVFQRLHGRTEYQGSGIGLAVCRRIVERHHGEITARSTLGGGSTFVVLLPVHQPQEIEL